MPGNKIFIGGLNYSTTEDILQCELEKHGAIVSIRIVTRHDTGISRGFAFATFLNVSDARDAVTLMDNTVFDGRRIGVKYAVRKGQGNV